MAMLRRIPEAPGYSPESRSVTQFPRLSTEQFIRACFFRDCAAAASGLLGQRVPAQRNLAQTSSASTRGLGAISAFTERGVASVRVASKRGGKPTPLRQSTKNLRIDLSNQAFDLA